ncbi:MAG: FtsQ-type POTRA domain-containing protein [Oscillospiraceae bacterium]|nr:FtsQ-type POTRA domain-containing protein [Oscillospiraceae bacterium]
MDTKQKKRPPAGRTGTKPRTRQAATGTKRRPVKKEETKNTAKTVHLSADVVYLSPKPFNRNRLVLRLVTVVAVVLAIVLGLSVFFKVEVIEVSGFDKYTALEVEEASGIKSGDHLLTFGRTKAAGKIISALPYIKSARIGIKLPNTVKIEIVEVDVTYALKASDGSWWLMSAAGKVVEQAPNEEEIRHTKILGVQLESPKVGENAIAWQDPVPPTDENGNPIPVTVTAAERLNAVISIAGFLEQNRIIGKMASIDVNHLMNIQLWYGNQYQILLGSTEQLGVKIAMMKAALSQVDYDEGILDIRDPGNILFKEFT